VKFINLHTHEAKNQANVLELINQYPQEFDSEISSYSIGIHPWYSVKERLESDLEIIESKMQDKNCLALGECGLDKRIEIPLPFQQMVFEKQLELAVQYQKPVIIHCVAAFNEVIAIKKKMNISVPMIIHGFSKNETIAQQLIDHGFYLSFGKYLIRNPELESVFKSIPNNRLFLETDTIEEGIEEIYHLAAKYKQLSLNELQEIIESNFNTVFDSIKK
jgi:TatD DNase family protein